MPGLTSRSVRVRFELSVWMMSRTLGAKSTFVAGPAASRTLRSLRSLRVGSRLGRYVTPLTGDAKSMAKTPYEGYWWGVGVVVAILGLVLVSIVTNLDAFISFVAVIAMMTIGMKIGRRALHHVQWTRPVKLLSDPVPESWADIVRSRVPLTSALEHKEFSRLLKLIQVFLKKKRIEGAGGLEVTEEMAVTIAAQACLLLLWRNFGVYPVLRSVIVYPGAVIPRYAQEYGAHGNISGGEHDQPILGQSWGSGVVVLSWNSAQRGAFDPRDGKNVVLHEFAHQLDQETGAADGKPVGLMLSSLKPWAEVMERRFQQLTKARRRGEKTVLDQYGAKNHAEFFAVATEAFFEKPRQLRKAKPDLYGLLREFFGVDPARGWAAHGTERSTSRNA